MGVLEKVFIAVGFISPALGLQETALV